MYDRGAVQNHDYTSIYFLLRSTVSILFYVSVCVSGCVLCVAMCVLARRATQKWDSAEKNAFQRHIKCSGGYWI